MLKLSGGVLNDCRRQNDWLRKAITMMTPATTSAAWIRGVVSTLEAQGLDVPTLFADAGLSVDSLDDPDERWPTEQVNRLWTLAVERSGNPAVALANPHLARPDQYGIAGYAMMSSADLQTGLCRLMRYLGIVSDAATISLVPTEGGQWVKLDLSGGASAVPRQRYEYDLLTLLAFCRWTLGRPLTPLAAAFSDPPPRDQAPYDEAFSCPFQWNASFNAFLVAEKDLASRLRTAIPQLAEVHDRIAGLMLRKLERPPTTRRAKEAIIDRLQDGTPLRSRIAADLGLSDHTLQRRLDEEGTSFTQLVEDTRRELAEFHLADPQMSLCEIVYLLGYSDQSTFFRACLRWFGKSPSEYRAGLITAGVGA
jgi:AraC-like DNA-binding protein